MRKIPLTYLLLFLPAILQAQVTGADSLFRADPDSLAADRVTVPSDSLSPDAIQIVPWRFQHRAGADTAVTDSLLRWQIWPDWTWKRNRDPDVITWRMGTTGRTNALQSGAQEGRYQQLLWENVPMNDPVSGSLNWSLIPLNKVDVLTERDIGTAYRTRYYLKRYHLTQPLSRISYDESSFNTRSMDFMVSHNLNRRLNLEVSYADRRDGGGYSNSGVAGRQIFFRASRELDPRRSWSLQVMNNHFTVGQPLGYEMESMFGFPFDRFTAAASEPTAQSEYGSTVMMLQYYRRPQPDSAHAFQAGLWFNSRNRSFHYPVNQTEYRVHSAGTSLSRHWSRNLLSGDAEVRMEQYFNDGGELNPIARRYWGRYGAEGTIRFRPFSALTLTGAGGTTWRSDGYSSYRLNMQTNFRIGRALELEGGYSSGSVMPTPQQLYREAPDFSGNRLLRNEQVEELHSRLHLNLFEGAGGGIRLQTKRIENAIMVGADSTFFNTSPYRSNSATGYLEYNRPHLELSGSATLQRLQDNGFGSASFRGDDFAERIWLKGGAFWKGYLFDRAAYVKAGVWAMTSPQRYRSDRYHPVLDFWQPEGAAGVIPQFSRLDIDISARVRTIMLTLRWENVLDDVAQLGYFESARYPMPQRRLLFGFRALFRN